jgi:hypothetical protein
MTSPHRFKGVEGVGQLIEQASNTHHENFALTR